MIEDYSIILKEEKALYRNNEIVHHPLSGPYAYGKGQGLLSFSSGNLAESTILHDINVFHLLIYGKPEPNPDEREEWADPIRAEALKRLQFQNWNWYLSFEGYIPDPSSPTGYTQLDTYILNTFIQQHRLGFTYVSSEDLHSHAIKERLFFEVSQKDIEKVIYTFWPLNYISSSIQGYLLPPSRIDTLAEWNLLPRDEHLFRKVIDTCAIVFYTFPEENTNFAFLTNKFSFGEIKKMLNINALQGWANEIKK